MIKLDDFLKKLMEKKVDRKEIEEALFNLTGFAKTLLKMQMEMKYGKTIG